MQVQFTLQYTSYASSQHPQATLPYHSRTHMPLSLRAKNLISYYEVSRCRDVSVGGGSNCGGHPYISFLFRMNFFISCEIEE